MLFKFVPEYIGERPHVGVDKIRSYLENTDSVLFLKGTGYLVGGIIVKPFSEKVHVAYDYEDITDSMIAFIGVMAHQHNQRGMTLLEKEAYKHALNEEYRFQIRSESLSNFYQQCKKREELLDLVGEKSTFEKDVFSGAGIEGILRIEEGRFKLDTVEKKTVSVTLPRPRIYCLNEDSVELSTH